MPDSEKLFVKCIKLDLYGFRICAPSTPEEHRCNWKLRPPPVDDNLYIAELLGKTAQAIGTCEAMHIGLYKVLINLARGNPEVPYGLQILEAVPHRTHISADMLSIGIGMIELALGHMLFGKEVIKSSTTVYDPAGFPWLAPDIFLQFTTHLDNECNVKENILELVEEISLKRRPGRIAYGILFSFFHCVIVPVDEDTKFKSTVSMHFLPSYHTISPSTPGITAVACLGYHCLTTGTTDTANTLPPAHFLNQVPLDMVAHIVTDLGPSDLASLTSAVPLFSPAMSMLLRYPFIDEYCLVEVLPFSRTPALMLKVFSALDAAGSDVPALVVGKHGHSQFLLLNFLGELKAVDVGYELSTRDDWELEAKHEEEDDEDAELYSRFVNFMRVA
ncbi:hypothetical protein DFH07DRAFT_775202 [Mycena maculata]|uniref:Uncharacterized protein n=1 Tax=Mycena maculata TaxID=230809 RepID=A0AAD7ITI5_9AGAR|nr:hypothetical protein DFH07DRAFT_775202 [Mycena maculata]